VSGALAPARPLKDSSPVQRTVGELTQQLLDSYSRVGGINHVDGKNLPSKAVVAQMTQDVLRLLFPGFFGERMIHSAELELETTALLASVHCVLEREVYKSLEYLPPEGASERDLAPLATEITASVLGRLPHVRDLLRTDTEAAYSGDPAALSREEVIVSYPFIEAVAVQRFAHELYLRGVALIPRLMTEWAHARTGLDIHPGAQIGTHFFVDHCTGTVVGETTIIGDHVKMYQGVGLVARSLAGGQQLRGTKRHPTIGDRVTIYANATIVGGDTIIGSGSTIGANVFLMNSVPANSLVVYEPSGMRLISKAVPDSVLNYEI
jgi:serine O-acetyltransferase